LLAFERVFEAYQADEVGYLRRFVDIDLHWALFATRLPVARNEYDESLVVGLEGDDKGLDCTLHVGLSLV
jgi:hypothetical protein